MAWSKKKYKYIQTKSQSVSFDGGNLLQLYSCFSWFICKHKTEKIRSQSEPSQLCVSPRLFFILSSPLSLQNTNACFVIVIMVILASTSALVNSSGISSRCLQRIWLNWMWCWFLVFFALLIIAHFFILSMCLDVCALCYDFSHSDQLYLFIYCFILLHVSFVVSFAFHI